MCNRYIHKCIGNRIEMEINKQEKRDDIKENSFVQVFPVLFLF